MFPYNVCVTRTYIATGATDVSVCEIADIAYFINYTHGNQLHHTCVRVDSSDYGARAAGGRHLHYVSRLHSWKSTANNTIDSPIARIIVIIIIINLMKESQCICARTRIYMLYMWFSHKLVN